MHVETFDLVPEEVTLVRQVRATKEKGRLLQLNKELSFRFERRLGEVLLASFGFRNVQWLNQGREHTGPESVDFFAELDARQFGVEMKYMAKETGGISIDPAKYRAIVRLGETFPEMRFALLILRVDDDGRSGSAILFMSP